jgi:hypothetical protein
LRLSGGIPAPRSGRCLHEAAVTVAAVDDRVWPSDVRQDLGEPRVELLEHDEDLERLADPWRDLERRVSGASLFATHDFIASSWRHFRTDTDRLFLIAVWQGDRLQAIAPLRLGIERLHRVPVRVIDWIAMWEGDRPSVLSALAPAACWSLIGGAMVRAAARWDQIRLREQPSGLQLPDELLRLVDRQVGADAVGHAIRLDGPFDDYLVTLSSGVRANWRKRRRKAFEVSPPCTVERVDATAEALPTALTRFVAVERQSWKGAARIGVGQDERHRAFYLDWLGRIGPDGASFHFLRSGDDDLAALMVLRHGRVAYSRHITYAPAHAALSPAVLLRAEVVRLLCEGGGLDELDLLGMRPSAGEQRHKTDWSTHRRDTWSHTLTRRRGRLAWLVLARVLKRALLPPRSGT